MTSQVEKDFAQEALASGYEVIRNGWPDCAIVRGKEVVFVECKSWSVRGDKRFLTGEQLRTLKLLEGLGLTVRVFVDDKGLLSVDEYLLRCKNLVINDKSDGISIVREREKVG